MEREWVQQGTKSIDYFRALSRRPIIMMSNPKKYLWFLAACPDVIYWLMKNSKMIEHNKKINEIFDTELQEEIQSYIKFLNYYSKYINQKLEVSKNN